MQTVTSALVAAIVAASSIVVLSVLVPSARALGDPIERRASCCASAVRVAPPESPHPVRSAGLIGDSLSVGITDDRYQVGAPIQDLFAVGGRSMWTDTSIGTSISGGVDILARRADQVIASDAVVVALGTNDIVGQADPDAWRDAIDSIVREVERSSPETVIVWVDLHFARFATRASGFNAVLRESADREPTLVVCGWNAAVSANPQWLGSDGLHLTGTGYAARRDVIVACVDDVQVG